MITPQEALARMAKAEAEHQERIRLIECGHRRRMFLLSVVALIFAVAGSVAFVAVWIRKVFL